MINLYNVDCMDFMAGLPDKAFDLAIVDPPYKNEFKIVASDKAAHVKRDFDLRSLNNTVPNDIYFNELRRVSRNQIVWGGKLLSDLSGRRKDRMGQRQHRRLF